MRAARVLFAIASADFLERVRRYSFLVTLAATGWLGWLVVRGKVTLRLGDYGGVVNGAWAGGLVSVTLSALVSLVGFWIVKGSVERDRETRVGEILAATPLSKPMYTLGKALSNFAVLAAIVTALAAVAPILVVISGARMDLVPMLTPFVLIALPAMAVIAALAVLFECFRPLSGGAGNVVWFFVWSALLAVPLATESPRADLTGLLILQRSMGAQVKAVHPDYDQGFTLSIGGGDQRPVKGTFEWTGLGWDATTVAARLGWFAVAALLALVAAVPFDRFDESRARGGRTARAPGVESVTAAASPPPPAAHLTPLPPRTTRWPPRILGVYRGELRLMLAGRPWWFWAVAGGLVVAGAVVPLETARAHVLPFAWFWPVLLWSGMGAREARDGTEALVFTAPHPLAAQLPALYAAGVTVALAAGAGVGLRCLAAGAFGALAAWLAGAAFIPALALVLGTWSGSSKVFEAVYTVLWYVGPMQPTPPLDFMGAGDAAIAAGMPAVTAGAAAVLLALAVAGRRIRASR